MFKNMTKVIERENKFKGMKSGLIEIRLNSLNYFEVAVVVAVVDDVEREVAFHFDEAGIVSVQVEIAVLALVVAWQVSAVTEMYYPFFHCHLHPTMLGSAIDESVEEYLHAIAPEFDA